MPKLIDPKMELIAVACRALAYTRGEDAKRVGDVAMRTVAQRQADAARAMAERFERGQSKG